MANTTNTTADKSEDTIDMLAEPVKKGTVAAPMMRVRVSSPFNVFFDEDAYSISGVNATGTFDILPHHHNFISLLSDGELVIRTRTEPATKIRISSGIMHVKADKVIVFLNV